MKHIKTFEQFINESADSVNEGAGDKEASTLAMKVADGLKKHAQKEKDSDLSKTYSDDAKDWVSLADLAKSDIKKAMKKYKRLDTVSMEYIADYLNKKDANKLADAFGVVLREEQLNKLELKEGHSQVEQAYVEAEKEFDTLFDKIQQAKFGWGNKTRHELDKISDQLLNLKKKYTSIKLD